VIEGYTRRLSEAVPDMARFLLGVPTLHPTIVSSSWVWQRGEPLERRVQDVGSLAEDDWLRSPLNYVLRHDIDTLRCDLTDRAQAARFPIFRTFVERGYTDYLLRTVIYEDDALASGIKGNIATFLSDAPGGFTDADIATIEATLPALSLSTFRLTLSDVARNLLSAYLGGDAGQRVLRGNIRRGDVERIQAAILYADIRRFTETSTRLPAAGVIGWLDDMLAALGDPTVRHGGEILKFLGDGMLAIFPIAGDEDEACGRALTAATEGLGALVELDRGSGEDRRSIADIALHVGEVNYGNIGASGRLDFTVIGPAVNEAARMEGMCDELGVNLVMSERFAGRTTAQTRALGAYRLRGVAEPQSLFTLTES